MNCYYLYKGKQYQELDNLYPVLLGEMEAQASVVKVENGKETTVKINTELFPDKRGVVGDTYENSLKDKGNSSKTKLNNIKVSAKGKMTYSYGQYQGDIKSETTLEAIKNGERTATTRYEADGHLDYWKNLKVGDIVEWEGKNGEKVLVEITKPLQKLTEKNLNGNEWSKLEGWSLDYYLEKVLPKIDTAWQMEYKLVDTQKANNSIPTNTPLFTTKVNQFTYSYNPTTQEVIHNAKTGDKVETNQTLINKVLVAYAKENNFPIQNFNKQDYVYINGKVLNSNTGAEVTNPKILTLFNAPIPVTSFSEFSSNVSLTDEDIEQARRQAEASDFLIGKTLLLRDTEVLVAYDYDYALEKEVLTIENINNAKDIKRISEANLIKLLAINNKYQQYIAFLYINNNNS